LQVIKKGGGNRPYEALATLCFLYEEGAKFYLKNANSTFKNR